MSEDTVKLYAQFISKQVGDTSLTEAVDHKAVIAKAAKGDDVVHGFSTKGHHVYLNHSKSDDEGSTIHMVHPDGKVKTAKITFDKHGEDGEVHHAKVNKALGMHEHHSIGKRIANSMNGMGGTPKWEA